MYNRQTHLCHRMEDHVDFRVNNVSVRGCSSQIFRVNSGDTFCKDRHTFRSIYTTTRPRQFDIYKQI